MCNYTLPELYHLRKGYCAYMEWGTMMWEGKEIMEDYGNNTSFFLKTPIILVFYLMVLTLLYI